MSLWRQRPSSYCKISLFAYIGPKPKAMDLFKLLDEPHLTWREKELFGIARMQHERHGGPSAQSQRGTGNLTRKRGAQ